MFAHLDPTGDDPAAVLSSPARSREPSWSESCAGGHFGGPPAPPRLRPCALFLLLWFALSSDSCFCFVPNQFHHEVLLCLPDSFHVFAPLGLEVEQMNLVAEADVPRLGHFSCPPHCLSFANLFAACWPPWPGLYPAGEYLGAAVESSLFERCATRGGVSLAAAWSYGVHRANGWNLTLKKAVGPSSRCMHLLTYATGLRSSPPKAP